MSTPRIKDFSVLETRADTAIFLEKRYAYTMAGLLEYIGYSQEPNASTTAPVWYIVKMTYSGTSIIRYQLPDTGANFGYIWNDHTNYFT